MNGANAEISLLAKKEFPFRPLSSVHLSSHSHSIFMTLAAGKMSSTAK